MKTKTLFRHLLPAIPMALLLFAPSWAGEVELKNGQKLSVERITFDGERFRIHSGGVEMTKTPADIRYLSANLKELQDKLTQTEKELNRREEELKSQREELEKRKAAGQDAKDLAGAAAESDTENRRLKKQIEMLEGEKSDLDKKWKKAQEALQMEHDRARQLQAALDEKTPETHPTQDDAPETVSLAAPFIFTHSVQTGTTGTMTTVQGEITNQTKTDFESVVFDLWARDAKGEILATAATFIPRFETGTSRPFAVDIPVNKDSIETIQIAPAHMTRQTSH